MSGETNKQFSGAATDTKQQPVVTFTDRERYDIQQDALRRNGSQHMGGPYVAIISALK